MKARFLFRIPILLLAVLPLKAQGPPQFSKRSIVNAATLSRPPGVYEWACGSIVTIFGSNLATGTASANQFPLPTALGGTQVLFDDVVPGRILYASPGQINLVTPACGPGSFQSISVATPEGSHRTWPVGVQGPAPGLFASDGSGCGRPAIYSHRLGRGLRESESLRPGDIATVYGTGFGGPYAPDGEASPAEPLLSPDPRFQFQVIFGGGTVSAFQQAEILWRGKAPGAAGIDQIDFRVPENVQESCAVPVAVIEGNPRDPRRSTQILSVPVSRTGAACENPARDGYLRLVLVREFNSGVPWLPARRDSLWVDFFGSPPPEPLRLPMFPGFCRLGNPSFRGRVCPGLEGVSNDHLAEQLVYQSQRWEAKVPQDAGVIAVTSGIRGATVRQGLPNGLPFYPPDLPVNFLADGPVRIRGGGGAHLGPFEAEITLPPFRVLNDLSPGTVVGAKGRPLSFRFAGGTPKGLVRAFLNWQCAEAATAGGVVFSSTINDFAADVDNELEMLHLIFNPDESEEVTFSADGLKYGGRLTYLYVYRFGGLKIRD